MEEIVQIAKGIALKYGCHAPQLLLFGEQGVVPMTFLDFPGEQEEKISYMFGAGKHCSSNHSIGKLNKVFFVSEAWMVRMNKDEPYIRPAFHPKRIEVLIISCLDCCTNEQTVQTLEYVRDHQGQLTDLKKY